MEIYGDTSKGIVRETNQDTFEFGSIDNIGSFAIVCDGMGGQQGGDVASKMACEITKKELISKIQPAENKNFAPIITSAIVQANKEIFNTAQSQLELAGMGTTIVAALLVNDLIYIAHVGDSRAYIIENNSINKITNDHSMVQEMLENGSITEEEASNHPQKNLITRALGIGKEVVVDCETRKISNGAMCLLCSDGLTNLISDNEILKIIRETATENAVSALIGEANARGGTDNITAVLIKN